MKISACVIAKNEAENLPNWLEQMSSLADEMIVVDTGSEDNTKELAAKAGAKVYDYQWEDDFAAAKNFAIGKASGDWIFFLDADEYFSDQTAVRLRKNLEPYHKDRRVGVILCRLINIDKDQNNKIGTTMLQSRIFRRKKGICYEGKVHEQVVNKIGNMRMVINADFVIYHTGYSTSIMRAKSERNLKMLLKQLEAAETDKERNRIACYLMDAYNGLGEYEKAIKCARQCIEADLRLVGMETHFYETIYSCLQMLGKPLQEILDFLDEALEKYPEEGSFIMEKGHTLFLMKDYQEAWKYLQLGLEKRREFEEKTYKGEMSSDTTLRLLPFIYNDLGRLCYEKGDKAQAAEYFYKGLQIYKYHAGTLAGLYKCLEGTDEAEIIQLLNGIYDRKKDWQMLVNVFAECNAGRLLAYYSPEKEKGKSVNMSVLYLLLGRYDGAAVTAAEQMQYAGNFLLAGLLKLEQSTSEEEKKQGQKLRGMLRALLGSRYQKLLNNTRTVSLEGKAVQRILQGKKLQLKG